MGIANVLSMALMAVSQGFLSVLFGRRMRRRSTVCRRIGFRRVDALFGGMIAVVYDADEEERRAELLVMDVCIGRFFGVLAVLRGSG